VSFGGSLSEAWHLRGVCLPDEQTRDVFVAGGVITFEPVADARTLIEDCYLIPGLVDSHAHLAFLSPSEGPVEARVRASAQAHLDAGVLLIREPGGLDHSSKDLGPHQGLPRVVTGGRFLAPPGGYFPDTAREVSPSELPDAAAEEAKASGAWAKIIGDFFGPDGRMRTNWETEELSEAARRVHAVGARITTHAVLAETIEQAIGAGFDAIEHGMEIGDDHAKAMAEKDIALVPTLFPHGTGEGLTSGMGMEGLAAESLLKVFHEHGARAMRAAELGVKVFAGTDAGSMVSHGQIASQIQLMIEAGFDPGVSLAAASWNARAWLGLPNIEEGAPADLVAFRNDPRADPATLAQPALVLLDGRRVRG
jgi:imidazolonepropionase-like amidohydrolase